MARARSYFIILFFFFRQRDGENKTIYLVTRSQTQHECWKGRRSLAVGEKIPGRATEYLQQRKRFFFFFFLSIKIPIHHQRRWHAIISSLYHVGCFLPCGTGGGAKNFFTTDLFRETRQWVDGRNGGKRASVCVTHSHAPRVGHKHECKKKKKYFIFLF